VDVETRLRDGVRWVESDKGARWAFRAAMVGAVLVLYIVGRHQWFIRDDWAFIFTRERVHQASGLDTMLFMAQDGHWMTGPILIFRGLHAVFGVGSYWPYMIPMMACHLGTAVMIRVLCLRVGVSAWTATILATMFAVFGSGWENIVFAIQLTYNMSLLGFLVHLWLIDHDGPPDWRDWVGVGVGLIAVSSSGFGAFIILGTLVFMVMRRRWRAAAIATVPTTLSLGWWWLFWGQDPAGDALQSSVGNVPAYVDRGFIAVFHALTTPDTLVGVAMLATLAVTLWRQRDARSHDLLLALGVTSVTIYIGLGLQRSGFGVDTAANSRYVYMVAALLIPAFGIAVDLLARLAPAAQRAGQLLLIAAIGMNISALRSNGNDWANRANAERNILELVATSPATATAPKDLSPLPDFSPDVQIRDIAELVADGAIQPRPVSTPAEQSLVDKALNHSTP
jgi:hypothetical protein